MRKVLNVFIVLALPALILISCALNNPVAPTKSHAQGDMLFALASPENRDIVKSCVQKNVSSIST